MSCAMISEIAASRMLSPFCTASVRAVNPSIISQASWNPEMRLNELNPNVEEKLSYKYSRLRCPSLARCRTMSLMPSLSLIPTVASNPSLVVLMPIIGIFAVPRRLTSSGLMPNEENEYGISVAAYGKFLEECVARFRPLDRVDDQIVPGVTQNIVKSGNDFGGEPFDDAAADQ